MYQEPCGCHVRAVFYYAIKTRFLAVTLVPQSFFFARWINLARASRRAAPDARGPSCTSMPNSAGRLAVDQGLLAVTGNKMPPRDPNDDDDEEEEEEDDEDLEPPVVRE